MKSRTLVLVLPAALSLIAACTLTEPNSRSMQGFYVLSWENLFLGITQRWITHLAILAWGLEAVPRWWRVIRQRHFALLGSVASLGARCHVLLWYRLYPTQAGDYEPLLDCISWWEDLLRGWHGASITSLLSTQGDHKVFLLPGILGSGHIQVDVSGIPTSLDRHPRVLSGCLRSIQSARKSDWSQAVMIRHEFYTKGRFLIQDGGVFYTNLPFLIKLNCSVALPYPFGLS